MMSRKHVWYCTVIFLTLICSISFAAQKNPDIQWKNVDGVSIPVPPSEHPRLYLRSCHIPALKQRMSDPVLKKVWQQLTEMSENERPEDDGTPKGWRYYVRQRGASVRAEMDALRYLITKDKALGRSAITTALDLMQKGSWPEVQDIARASGRLMVTGAIVFDWCHELLTEQEKKAFVTQFVRLAKTLECGYPPVKQGSVVGHSSEWMIMRDLLSAAIAIYDEYPEMYNLAAGRFFKEHLPVRNWFYPGHTYHQGPGYNRVRFSSDLYALWIFSRMGAGNVYNTAQQFIPYSFIYKRRADGQFLPSGDINPSRGRRASLRLLAMLCGSYYKDEYINHEFLLRPSVAEFSGDGRDTFFEFLWRDTQLGERDCRDLPLTRHFGFPFGWSIARTGWDADSVVAEMKINAYNFINHQHHDAGDFQIYYKGPLAIDSGAYTGSSGGYNSPHNKNYFKRTIAHNSLLIYDPNEIFKSMGYGGADKTPFVDNDGGQRLPHDGWYPPETLDDLLNKDYKTGEILAQGFGPDYIRPDYTYLKGDITKAYSNKVKEVKRSFVFLNLKNTAVPAALIVYDKVVSSEPSFKKYWLLHSIEEPSIKGNQVTITRTKNGDTGKLVNHTLLPEPDNADIIPIGGEGKEFWVFGTNYENKASKRRPDVANERGAWRVQLTPRKAAAEDYFLNIMQVMERTHNNPLKVGRLKSSPLIVAVRIDDRVVAFSRTTEVIDGPVTLMVTGQGSNKILIADLKPGTWQILKNGSVFIPAIPVRSDDGLLYFEGPKGEYKFLR